MTFSTTQIRQLARSAQPIGTTELDHAINEANRVFGYDAWDREIVSTECIWRNKLERGFHAAYTAKIRVTVRAGDDLVAREGHGGGEARALTPGRAHATALISAEADAMQRVLATFGRRFAFQESMKRRATKNEQVAPVTGKLSDRNDTSPTAQALNGETPSTPESNGIDKAALPLAEPRRRRSEDHLRHVRQQPCLVCGRIPSQAHHLRFAQPKALGRKVSDEFTVPLCSAHHDQLHHVGDEKGWWEDHGIDPIAIATDLWAETGPPKS